MRLADATTLFRVFIAIVVVYLVLIFFNPYIILLLIIAERVIDALDGFFARYEESRGKLGFWRYVDGAVFGNTAARNEIRKYNAAMQKSAPHGARFDIAGDRAVEYIFWALFAYISLVPLFVFIIVIIRHSFVDALMAGKGTASKIRSRFAQIVYASNAGRFLINVPKVLTFGYLPFVYIYGWPLWIGYVFMALLVFNILLRGAAEVYESFA